MTNRDIDGMQQTVVFHVDDLKVSCMKKEENVKFIEYLKTIYEVEGLKGLKATEGSRHEFLGMILDYSNKGEVKVDMTKYVDEMIKEFKEHMGEHTAKTPAANWLFEVRKHGKKLTEERKQEFHTMVAKALFLCR